MTESRYRWFVAMALLAEADGDPEGAVHLLDQAEQLYRPGFFPDVRPIAAMKARIWIAQGRLSEAADWARERGVSATDEVSYLQRVRPPHLGASAHRAAPGAPATPARLDQAAGLLDRLLGRGRDIGTRRELLEIRMLQALAHDAQGHRPQALESLAEALALAPEPDGYVRLFLDEGAPMISLLRGADHHGVAGDHARTLLSLGASAEAEALDLTERRASVVGRVVERPGAAGAQAARQRADRAGDRPRAVRLAQHGAHPHQAHLHQARRHQPPGGGPPRPRTRLDVTRPDRSGSHPVSHIVG